MNKKETMLRIGGAVLAAGIAGAAAKYAPEYAQAQDNLKQPTGIELQSHDDVIRDRPNTTVREDRLARFGSYTDDQGRVVTITRMQKDDVLVESSRELEIEEESEIEPGKKIKKKITSRGVDQSVVLVRLAEKDLTLTTVSAPGEKVERHVLRLGSDDAQEVHDQVAREIGDDHGLREFEPNDDNCGSSGGCNSVRVVVMRFDDKNGNGEGECTDLEDKERENPEKIGRPEKLSSPALSYPIEDNPNSHVVYKSGADGYTEYSQKLDPQGVVKIMAQDLRINADIHSINPNENPNKTQVFAVYTHGDETITLNYAVPRQVYVGSEYHSTTSTKPDAKEDDAVSVAESGVAASLGNGNCTGSGCDETRMLVMEAEKDSLNPALINYPIQKERYYNKATTIIRRFLNTVFLPIVTKNK